MKISLLKKLGYLTLNTGILLFFHCVIEQPTQAQPVDRDQNPTSAVEWDSLCQRFPHNSRCLAGRPEVIKIQLDASGAKDEWIRIEKIGDKVTLLHTRESDRTIVSNIFNGALGAAVPVPIPVKFHFDRWTDNNTTGVAFSADRCQGMETISPECKIIGKDTLILPKGTDIYAGLFTIEYTEGDLARSITFRIPQSQAK